MIMNSLILSSLLLLAPHLPQEKSSLELLFESVSVDLSTAEQNLEQAYFEVEALFAQIAADPTRVAASLARAIRLEAPDL